MPKLQSNYLIDIVTFIYCEGISGVSLDIKESGIIMISIILLYLSYL